MEDQINDILYYARVLSAYSGRHPEPQEVAIILIKKLEKLRDEYGRTNN
jgi:hypothetical protein